MVQKSSKLLFNPDMYPLREKAERDNERPLPPGLYFSLTVTHVLSFYHILVQTVIQNALFPAFGINPQLECYP